MDGQPVEQENVSLVMMQYSMHLPCNLQSLKDSFLLLMIHSCNDEIIREESERALQQCVKRNTQKRYKTTYFCCSLHVYCCLKYLLDSQ